MAARAAPDIGPNVSQEHENFFQTDDDLVRAEQKRAKAEAVGQRGDPVLLSSKVLSLTLCLGRGLAGEPSEPGTCAYVGLSGFVAQRVYLSDGRVSQTFRGHSGPVTCAAVQYGAGLLETALFTGSWDKTVRRWDPATGACLMTFAGHADFVKCVLVFRDVVFSGGSDGTLRRWAAASGECLATSTDHGRSVESLAVDDAGERLFSASSDTTIRQWDLATGASLGELRGHLSSVYCVLWADGLLYSASADKTAKRWAADSGRVEATYEHPDFVKAVAVRGRYLFTACRDETVRVFDLQTDRLVAAIDGHLDEVSALALHPTRDVLYSGSLDRTVRTWDVSAAGLKALGPGARKAAVKAAPAPAAVVTAEEDAELEALMAS